MILEQIESILSESSTKEQDILTLFDSIGVNLPIIPLTLRPGAKLIRGTINWVPAQFESVEQLSYKPAHLNSQYQRASIPGETMFYACPFTHSRTFESGIFYPRLTSLIEIRSLISEVDRDGIQRVTISRWDTTQEIRLFAIPFLAEYERPCDEILYIRSKWVENVSSNDYSRESIELIEYLSKDISEKKTRSEDYLFTALFINWFLSRHSGFSGVFYPSVQTKGEGANIAVKPNLVDAGDICFVEATESYVIKQGMRAEVIDAVRLIPDNGRLVSQPLDVLGYLEAMPNSISLSGLQFLN